MTPPRPSPDNRWPEAKPRLPGSGPKRAAGKKPFGATWWGAAWVDALEHRANLDANRLPRGRTYARAGQVEALHIEPGTIVAEVQGSEVSRYLVRIEVTPLTDGQWERVLDALAEEIGHAAALLDGELPPAAAATVRSLDLDLLPGPGEIRPSCTCPDRAQLCKHAAAVCYLVADELDGDPFTLLVLRGRERPNILRGLRERRIIAAPVTPSTMDDPAVWTDDEGLAALEAWQREPDPLPDVPSPPRVPGSPTELRGDPPPSSGLRLDQLQAIVVDAAERAWEMASGESESGLDLSLDEDGARWAATLLENSAVGKPIKAAKETQSGITMVALARALQLSDRELHRRALAWRDGGRIGFAVLVDSWEPTAEQLTVGLDLLGPSTLVRKNRLTHGDEQLRLGTDGHWYPYRRTKSGWDPNGPYLDEIDLAAD